MFTRALAAAAALVCLSAPALAQQRCVDVEATIPHLLEEFGETPTVTAVDNNGVKIVIFANSETGTWTVLADAGRGCTVLGQSGTRWRFIEPEPPGVDS